MEPNTGSFMAGDPQGQAAVQAAIAARQGGTSAPQLSQQGQMMGPEPVQSPVEAQSQGMAQPMVAPQDEEKLMIVKGLTDRLKSISKAEADSVKMEGSPQQAPVGGGYPKNF